MATKTFERACTIYALLEANGRQATEGHIFEGSLKGIVTGCEDVPDQSYQQVRDLLGNLGCIRYLRTGHGPKNPSLIQLVQPPNLELYNEFRYSKVSKEASVSSKRVSGNEVMYGRMNDLVKRVDRLEADFRTLMGVNRKALRSHDDNG